MATYPTPPHTSSPEHYSSKLPAEDSYHLVNPEPRTSSPHQSTSPPPLGASKPRPRGRSGSPVHRVSSPYGKRAKPRGAFMNRMLAKFRRFLGTIATYGRKVPVALGLLTMLPIIAGAAVFRVGRGLVGLLSGKEMGPNLGLGRSKSLGSLKDFKILGGTKGNGPLDGIFRIFRMLLKQLM